METQTQPRIRVGRTEMDFPHQGKNLIAVHPFYGPANSRTLRELIRADGLVEPTAAELVSFVSEYFLGEEAQAQEVTRLMKDSYFRGFTGILYNPNDGLAHFINYPEFGENSIIDKDNLLARLPDSYAQVPFNQFKEGAVNWKEVAKHPYFIAFAGGKEGAERLSELASKHPTKEACLWTPDVSNLSQPEARVANLYSDWDGNRLSVDGDLLGFDDRGRAFGVLPYEKVA